MKRCLLFAKRNFYEIMRDPLSLIFNFAFPIAMLGLFSIFIYGKSAEFITASMPMFAPKNIVPAVVVFGYSFLALFAGTLVSGDRSTAFAERLRATPLRPFEFYLGYALPMFGIALLQALLIYLAGTLFSLGVADASLRFVPTFGAFLALIYNLPTVVFFISAGIGFGVLVSGRAIGGVASILINCTGILSGMFMPLVTMGSFKTVCTYLPFFHAVALASDTLRGVYPASVDALYEAAKPLTDAGLTVTYGIGDLWWMHFAVLFLWCGASVLFSVLAFKKKMSK